MSTNRTSSSLNPGRTDRPPAVVVGLDSLQGLQAARILAWRGVPVVGMSGSRIHSGSKTRVCREMVFAPTRREEVVDHLVELGPRLEQKAVLFPSEDPGVMSVSRHRERLEPWYHVLLPPHDVVEMLMDKVRFYTYAREQGFPITPTCFVENESQLEEAAARLRFPCVLKPRDSAERAWENQTMHKAFKLQDANELRATYAKFKPFTSCFIVQEWIEGGDADLYSCNCYFDKKAEPLVTFIARKIRQWPPGTGISCLGEECRNDTVLEESLRLFRSVNYHGLGYVEMKQDQRDGAYYIVEPNIGRPTGRSAIAEGGGVELLYTAYCDAVGLPLPANRQQLYRGVKWMNVRKDLQSSIYYWRKGELTFREWLRSVRGKKVYGLASWRDPLPFFRDLLHAVTSVLSSKQRRKRAYVPNHKEGGAAA